MEKKIKNIFIDGPVTAHFIAEDLQKHAAKHSIGAHSMFMGQVRADEKPEGQVSAIEYTAYPEMALETMHVIREETFTRYNLTCLHVYHSLGMVKAGEISLFVFTSSAHRRDAIDACNYLVERIKSELPVWGKEIITNGHSEWKVNR
jgi:molybdopterin synthase catalytic subunit